MKSWIRFYLFLIKICLIIAYRAYITLARKPFINGSYLCSSLCERLHDSWYFCLSFVCCSQIARTFFFTNIFNFFFFYRCRQLLFRIQFKYDFQFNAFTRLSFEEKQPNVWNLCRNLCTLRYSIYKTFLSNYFQWKWSLIFIHIFFSFLILSAGVVDHPKTCERKNAQAFRLGKWFYDFIVIFEIWRRVQFFCFFFSFQSNELTPNIITIIH